MAFPVDIPTRTVTLGGAAALESGAPLILAVTVRASRSLIWNETGFRLERTGVEVTSEPGDEVTLTLPRTDVLGWRDADTGEHIDVSTEGSFTHRYVAEVRLRSENGQSLSTVYTVGPFVVPGGEGPLDLDKLLPAATVKGDAVSVPDMWSQLVEQAEAAAQAAVEAAANAPGAVHSVNGKTGEVTLTAEDVGARPDDWSPDLSGYATTGDLAEYVTGAELTLTLGGYAPADHTHTGYAPVNHTHEDYAPVDHEHEDYALANHEHEEYALANHTHTGYAATEHTHDVEDVDGLQDALDARVRTDGTVVELRWVPSVDDLPVEGAPEGTFYLVDLADEG